MHEVLLFDLSKAWFFFKFGWALKLLFSSLLLVEELLLVGENFDICLKFVTLVEHLIDDELTRYG